VCLDVGVGSCDDLDDCCAGADQCADNGTEVACCIDAGSGASCSGDDECCGDAVCDMPTCCFEDVGAACGDDDECCGALECDDTEGDCCIPGALALITCDNDDDCCDGSTCNGITNLCNAL
jgi:hypothetical protein